MTAQACVSLFPLLFLLLSPSPTPVVQVQDYAFPFRGEDLKPGERISTGNHAAGIQAEGEDIGARRYLGDGKWSHLLTGSGKSNTDFVVYEKPVHAMADGKVVGCWRNAPENPAPPAKHDQFETGTKMVGGKAVPVGRIPGGGNMLFVDNGDGKRVLYAHMTPGSIPAELCPNNATLLPKEMTIPEGDAYLMLASSAYVSIKKGQLLGRAGNSGSSSAPHLHVHAEQSGKAAIMRFEKGLSKRYVENKTDIQGGWNDFSGEEVPDGEVLIRPARATPYRMTDLEVIDNNGQLTYVGIFRPASYGPMALFESDWTKFLAGWRAIEGRGYRMKDFESYRQGSRQVYAGIFAPGSHGPMALFEASWPTFLKGWQAIEAKGYRMKDLEVFGTGGARRYAGIFEPDNAWADGALQERLERVPRRMEGHRRQGLSHEGPRDLSGRLREDVRRDLRAWKSRADGPVQEQLERIPGRLESDRSQGVPDDRRRSAPRRQHLVLRRHLRARNVQPGGALHPRRLGHLSRGVAAARVARAVFWKATSLVPARASLQVVGVARRRTRNRTAPTSLSCLERHRTASANVAQSNGALPSIRRIKLTARSRRSAASCAIWASPSRSSRGTRRSRASMSR